jgi:tyrosine decarboxylase / aspartate 1-decarboxylase
MREDGPPFLDEDSLRALRKALEVLGAGFADLPPAPPSPVDGPAIEKVLLEAAHRLRDNFPYFHPLYAGQMLAPPHPMARLAYALSLWINPNNHALDGGRASSLMEKEAVAALARMVGWDAHLGHLTSGGTMANLEALWVAGRLKPGSKVLASRQAHYTHKRLCGVLRLGFESIPCDRKGRMDIAALRARIAEGGIGAVVATLGTTATGAVDPLPEILDIRERYDFRLHVDAAYGGYFVLAHNLERDARRAFNRMNEVDSIVIDPHKHGLQPYGCGCVIFNDPAVGHLYKHESPYTYFSSPELHLGEISLECSRPGAAAVALWATQKLLPLIHGGEFAGMLGESRAAAMELHRRLSADGRFLTTSPPELDIVAWTPRAPRASDCSAAARRIFAEAARRHLHLALADLPADLFALSAAGIDPDADTITCLRSVLMKPDHQPWLDRIWDALDQATAAALAPAPGEGS